MQSGMLILCCGNKFKIHDKSEELENMFQKVVLLNHFAARVTVVLIEHST